ncbi:MAG: HAD family hydrolase [Pseudomonadota bacterium]
MRACIFDLDGTLVQSTAIDAEIFNGAIETILGPVRLRASFSDYTHVTDSGIVAEVLVDNGYAQDPSLVKAIRLEFVNGLAKHVARCGPFAQVPGAASFLRRLQNDATTRVAIATGGWREPALLKLTSAAIAFDRIPVATSSESPSRTEIMQSALERIGERVSSVTYFGDAAWDAQACSELDWEFVAVGPALGGIQSYDEVVIQAL